MKYCYAMPPPRLLRLSDWQYFGQRFYNIVTVAEECFTYGLVDRQRLVQSSRAYQIDPDCFCSTYIAAKDVIFAMNPHGPDLMIARVDQIPGIDPTGELVRRLRTALVGAEDELFVAAMVEPTLPYYSVVADERAFIPPTNYRLVETDGLTLGHRAPFPKLSRPVGYSGQKTYERALVAEWLTCLLADNGPMYDNEVQVAWLESGHEVLAGWAMVVETAIKMEFPFSHESGKWALPEDHPLA